MWDFFRIINIVLQLLIEFRIQIRKLSLKSRSVKVSYYILESILVFIIKFRLFLSNSPFCPLLHCAFEFFCSTCFVFGSRWWNLLLRIFATFASRTLSCPCILPIRSCPQLFLIYLRWLLRSIFELPGFIIEKNNNITPTSWQVRGNLFKIA